jgi:hypothetical protein
MVPYHSLMVMGRAFCIKRRKQKPNERVASPKLGDTKPREHRNLDNANLRGPVAGHLSATKPIRFSAGITADYSPVWTAHIQ